jgi:hypothetical protein
MARMYPEEYREDPESPSDAERVLYRGFAEQLPDDFLVFHRRPWHAPNARGSARDGETDFVVAHEKLGILVIEAKSGGVARDPKTGDWHAVDFGGRRLHPIDDPIGQAMRCQKSLLRRLKDLPRGADRWWTVGHAVAFPDIDFDVRLLEATPEIVLDRDDLPYLKEWTEAAMKHWADFDRHQPLGEEGIGILSSLLALGFEIRPLLTHRIGRHEREIARLTLDQYRVLDGLARVRRAHIAGCAGSGKTMLALEKARRFAEQGYRPLYVCFNKLLRDSSAEFLKGWPNATVDNFHGLCQKWARKAGLKVEERDERDYYDRALPEALVAAARKIPDRFDAVIVDEGQDFKPGWWKPLQGVLKDGPRGILYVFYDDSQNLYSGDLRFPPADGRYDLPENCRNLRRIHDLVVRFYRSDRRIFSRASPGEKPEILVYRSEAELLDAVEKAVLRLTRDHKVSPRQMAVLTGHGKEKSAVWRARRFGGFTLADKAEPAEGEIFWSTVHAFKGLERSVVVLAEIEPLSHAELDTILYVGCSRARVHLVVIASETAARLADLEETGTRARRDRP